MRRQFDTLQSSVKKYRAKSQMAINGLNNVIQQANLIAELPNVESKWKYIATYMGLQQEGNNSFYNTFVPLNNDILFLLRNGNHNNANPELYNRHEKLGRPDKRFVVYRSFCRLKRGLSPDWERLTEDSNVSAHILTFENAL